MARPQRPWFRFYTEMPRDPKIRRLTPEQRWIWCCILAAARVSPEPGSLLLAPGVPMTAGELADLADVRRQAIKPLLAKTTLLGMTRLEDATVVVVNFKARQFESDDVTARTRKWRAVHSAEPVIPGMDEVDETGRERSQEPARNVPTGASERSRNGPETETETEGLLTPVNPGGATTSTRATPTPFCPRHPSGTDQPCIACRDARLAHQATTTATHKPTRPPWCGQCDETTRHLNDNDTAVRRCPRCHPLALKVITGGNP